MCIRDRDKIDCTRSMSQIVHETIKVKEATNRSIEVEARLASKKLATYLEAVSYTHLDVYKRQ